MTDNNRLSASEIRQFRAMLLEWQANKPDLIAVAEMSRSFGRFSKIIAAATVVGGAGAFLARLLEVI